jgi:hypothetical protein
MDGAKASEPSAKTFWGEEESGDEGSSDDEDDDLFGAGGKRKRSHGGSRAAIRPEALVFYERRFELAPLTIASGWTEEDTAAWADALPYQQLGDHRPQGGAVVRGLLGRTREWARAVFGGKVRRSPEGLRLVVRALELPAAYADLPVMAQETLKWFALVTQVGVGAAYYQEVLGPFLRCRKSRDEKYLPIHVPAEWARFSEEGPGTCCVAIAALNLCTDEAQATPRICM